MFEHALELIGYRDPYFGMVRFWLREKFDGRVAVGEITMKTIEDNGLMPPETFTLSESRAQQLMDTLWREGFRPTEGTGSAGALAAVQKHLEDMRTLVFKDKD